MTTIQRLGEVLPSVPVSVTADREPTGSPADFRELQERVAKLVRHAGGDRYAGYKFSSWQEDSGRSERVKQAVQEWADTFPERLHAREALVLYGPVGTGKDHLLFAAVRQAILQHGAKASWRNGRDLMGEIRDRISENASERSLIESLEYPQILAISDPLPVRGDLTQHQADMMYRVVENRYAAGKMTCITINVADDAEADERLGAATWDRLCHNAWKCRCNWSSYRKPARVVE